MGHASRDSVEAVDKHNWRAKAAHPLPFWFFTHALGATTQARLPRGTSLRRTCTFSAAYSSQFELLAFNRWGGQLNIHLGYRLFLSKKAKVFILWLVGSSEK